MSIAESQVRPNARAHLANWLQGYRLISENDTTAELIKHSRALGGHDDPLIAHCVRECEAEEQRAREQRHDQQQRQIAQHIDQQNAEATQQQLDIWWYNELAAAIGFNDEKAFHPAIATLLDAIGEANGEIEKALQDQIDNAKEYAKELVRAFGQEMKGYLDEVRTVVSTHFQTAEKRHTEAIEQITEQLAGINNKLNSADVAIADLKLELGDDLGKRIAALETLYEQQREQDAKQIKALAERLTAVERHSDAVDRKQFNNLEATFWNQREDDARQQAKQTKEMASKVAAVERQMAEAAHEVKEVQRDLKRATDMTQEIHQMELRLDERRAREQERKRGPRGAMGPAGPQGERGVPGRDGKDGHTVVLKTKKWEANAEEFKVREILSDGSRMPALDLRPLIEGNFQPLFLKLLPQLDRRYQSMTEDAIDEAIAKAKRR